MSFLQIPAKKGRRKPKAGDKDGGNTSSGCRVLSMVADSSSRYKPLPDEHQNLKYDS